MHEAVWHLGVQRVLALLQTGHWWYGMRCTVQSVLRKCRARGFSNMRVRGPFYRMGVDLGVPLTPSPTGNTYCTVVISASIAVLPIKSVHPYSTVLARFGAPAEVLTATGASLRGSSPSSFSAVSSTIDTRPEDALRKACDEAAGTAAWELAIPDLLLGCRCSPQKSTRYSPYELLYGGVTPIILPAVKERLLEPNDFEDPAAALASLQQQAGWVRQVYPAAAGNLLIAQHRDALCYSASRTGRYLAKPTTFAPGDYVYVRHGNATDTLRFLQHDIVLRVETVGPLGVAILLGWDGVRTRRRAEQLRPCHLDIDLALSPQLSRPQRDLQCELCGSQHQAAKTLLGSARAAWSWAPRRLWAWQHSPWGRRLHPCPFRSQPSAEVQLGCRPSGGLGCSDAAAAVAPGRGVAGRNEELGRLLFPQAANLRRDEAAAALQGRRVLRAGARVCGGAAAQQSGVLEYLGALAWPRYFVVCWDDGTEEESRADAT
ncbi:hypothetical protein TSOC_014652 [Tetrabaena socialis]|uniref:Uncharacterized protein n=1 Tax=Tetrabaena socialis TaxID=47790 RepID=A0A2J7ZH28_9CHLO|nr:hypothetical protein TSOC_014652 [Tetrabaena socialis]|eukprot:PNG99566.1 hypothetical protein TSOC_014652 [Tetrabaena socialis]